MSIPSWNDIDHRELPPALEAGLDRLARGAHGAPEWRRRMRAEVRSLVLLADAVPWRLALDRFELGTDLRVALRLRVTLPVTPSMGNSVRVEQEARLGLIFPQDILRGPVAGTSVALLLHPRDVWHPNVSPPAAVQGICLGPRIARGTPLREILWLCYAGLSMQIVPGLDPLDPAGVLNPAACGFWREHGDAMPLSRTPFLGRAAGEAALAGSFGASATPDGTAMVATTPVEVRR